MIYLELFDMKFDMTIIVRYKYSLGRFKNKIELSKAAETHKKRVEKYLILW